VEEGSTAGSYLKQPGVAGLNAHPVEPYGAPHAALYERARESRAHQETCSSSHPPPENPQRGNGTWPEELPERGLRRLEWAEWGC
jgi:hypothetical protein